jgi:hypothetical protein
MLTRTGAISQTRTQAIAPLDDAHLQIRAGRKKM